MLRVGSFSTLFTRYPKGAHVGNNDAEAPCAEKDKYEEGDKCNIYYIYIYISQQLGVNGGAVAKQSVK